MIKSTKHEYHGGLNSIYLAEHKGSKFKIEKREAPSTEWNLLEFDNSLYSSTLDCDYEFYHWVATYQTKALCLKYAEELAEWRFKKSGGSL